MTQRRLGEPRTTFWAHPLREGGGREGGREEQKGEKKRGRKEWKRKKERQGKIRCTIPFIIKFPDKA